MRVLSIITANGKSIGEVRAFEELKVQEIQNVANAFSILLTYKKLQNWKAWADYFFCFSILHFSPHFANTMLYAVLFVHTVCEYAGVAVGNLFFFGGGEKREGKSSFAILGFALGEADCKCAFS